MKTIFRQLALGLMMAAFIALGAVAGFAQDPCSDADGQGKLYDRFGELFTKTTIDDKKATIAAGKQFLEKYGSCESAKDSSDYLKTAVPALEKALAARIESERFNALLTKFDNGLKTSNWDDVYDAGKQILSEKPDEFRDAELVLGSIGLDETAKTPRVTKWNDDTLKYAKMSIADLEGGKTFKRFGVSQFIYKSKDNALGWMNYTIGYLYYFDKNDKKQGLSYLYKASQLNSETKTNPVVFESIGSYYFDEVRRLAAEVDVLAKAQDPKDAEEVAKQKVDAIKAKVALVNGTAEAAFDAYARAYNFAKADPKSPKAYVESLNKKLHDLYNVRFGKPDGYDAFIANTVKKPLPNPLLPIAPISDPEPVVATGATTTTTVKPAATTGKPPVTTPAKPASNPTKPPVATPSKNSPGTKPQAVVKKPVVKKKGA